MRQLLIILIIPILSWSQDDQSQILEEAQAFQAELNEYYLNKETSPLKNKERRKFEHHNFWEISTDYVVTARFERITTVDTVVMGTSAGTKKLYQPFAMVYFTIDGQECELTVYQSLKWRDVEGYENFLFLPFRDATSGKGSYGGGRYLDLEIPENDEIVLNFNLAYNPYCAYTTGYFCTIPPANNTLEVPIKAGLKAPEDH